MIRRSPTRMTVTQLKRHMDCRFAITNKRLRQCATKEDLARFATKEDLARFATKEDLDRRFGEVMRRLDSLSAKMDSNFESVNSKIYERERVFDEYENRIRDLEAQVGR